MRTVTYDSLRVLRHAKLYSCRQVARRRAWAAFLTMDIFAPDANHEDYVPGER